MRAPSGAEISWLGEMARPGFEKPGIAHGCPSRRALQQQPKRDTDQRLLKAKADGGGYGGVSDREGARHAAHEDGAGEAGAQRRAISFWLFDHFEVPSCGCVQVSAMQATRPLGVRRALRPRN